MAIVETLAVVPLEASFAAPAEVRQPLPPVPRWRRWLARSLPPPAAPVAAAVQFHLESPVPGSQSEHHFVEFRGWLSSPLMPASAVEVLGPDGRLLQLRPIHPRPEVGVPGAIGFAGTLTTLGLPTTAELTLVAVLAPEVRVPVAKVQLRRAGLACGGRAGLQPLLVHALIRADAACTLRLLREHPAIVAAGGCPCEAAPAQFWARQMQSQVQPLPPEDDRHQAQEWQTWDPRSYPDAAVQALRPWFGGAYVDELAAACRSHVQAFYRQVARQQARGSAAYFLERTRQSMAARLVQEVFPHGREIFLVRDFRDLFWIDQYADRRRHRAAAPETPIKEDSRIHDLAERARQFHQWWQERRQRALLVRYEDLYLKPEETLERILSYLEVDRSAGLIADIVKRVHESDAPELAYGRPATAIGHWRRHLSDAQQDQILRSMRGLLHAFGYGAAGIFEIAA